MSEKEKDGDVSGETKEFDASAFTSSGIVDSAENSADENNSNESEDSSGEDNSSGDSSEDDNEQFDWADTSTDDNQEDSNDNEDADSSGSDDNNNPPTDADNNDTDDSTETDGSNDNSDADGDGNNSPVVFDGSLTDEHFTAFASELGIKATNMTELKEAMLELEADNKRLQESSGGNVTNKKINSLQEYLKLNSKELLEKDLEAQGFSGDKLSEALDTLQDNGMLEIEATKVRNAINGSIKREQDSLTQGSKDADAKQTADRDNSVKELQTYLNSQTDMFGFKMAKDEESLTKVRDNHHKYITSGSFLQEITKDNESLAESAWLWRNRTTLLKAARNNGLQRGRSEILSDLGNPDTGGSGTYADPSGKGKFDPSKFGASDKS